MQRRYNLIPINHSQLLSYQLFFRCFRLRYTRHESTIHNEHLNELYNCSNFNGIMRSEEEILKIGMSSEHLAYLGCGFGKLLYLNIYFYFISILKKNRGGIVDFIVDYRIDWTKLSVWVMKSNQNNCFYWLRHEFT